VTPRRVLAEKRHLIWPIAIALLVNAGLFAFVVYPLAQKVDGGEQAAAAATGVLNAARREDAAARATVEGKGQADAELQKFYGDVLPPDFSGARRITYLPIETLAKQHRLRLERQTSDAAPQHDSSLAKFTYTAALSGEYRDIRRFIHALETAPEFLVLEHVELTQGDAKTEAVKLQVQIATYYRTGAHGD
jgi:hypothetical protein